MSAGDNANAGVSRFALRCGRLEESKTAAPQCCNTHGSSACVGDDWDVYYERGRKPKESIIKYEATRSEGDYPEEGATRALMRYRRERHGSPGGRLLVQS